MTDAPHGIRDRELHAVPLAELADRHARLDAFRDLTVVCRFGLSQGLAAAETLTEGAVARQRRRAGGDEVTEPGEPGEGLRVGAETDAQPADLGEPAGDQRG